MAKYVSELACMLHSEFLPALQVQIEAGADQEPCPCCGAISLIRGTSKGAKVLRCPECTLHFLTASVRLLSEMENNWYADMNQNVAAQGANFLQAMDKSYSAQLRAMAKLTEGRRILDVGCGVGVFLASAKKSGWDVQGTDASVNAAQFAKLAYSLNYVSDCRCLPAHSFDVVRASHVLEHVPEPASFVSELRRLVKPGGVLQIVVPNNEALLNRWVNAWRAKRSSRPRLALSVYPVMHCLGLTQKSLATLAKNAGFIELSAFCVSRGNSDYFPWDYDGLLSRMGMREFIRNRRRVVPEMLAMLGNRFGLGAWQVGLYRSPYP